MENLPATTDIAQKLNTSISKVLSQSQVMGFEKAFLIASAVKELKHLLSSEYMAPIMELQNNRLGFKTDKELGYPETIVKNCLIEAVLMGVQPFGNQFNIIAGNCYITKEGFDYLLKNINGLDHEIIPELPRIGTTGSAAIVMKIKWTLAGMTKDRAIDIPIKVNQYMGTDAIIGKATRKAEAWLYRTITGINVSDGDANENDAKRTILIPSQEINKEEERVLLMIQDTTTQEELEKLRPSLTTDALVDAFALKREAFLNSNTNQPAVHRGNKMQ
jgi:hypothetical protein